MAYTPLTLRIDTLAEGSYRATLRHPKDGSSDPVDFAWKSSDIFWGDRSYSDALKDINDFKATSERNPYLENLGSALYRLVFQGNLEMRFKHWSTLGDVLAIRIVTASEIGGLPWELLRDSAFLGQRLSILRFDERVGDRSLAFGKELQALVVSASPKVDGLSFDDEPYLTAVESKLASIGAKVTVLRLATRTTLQKALSDHKPQILHFVGHGKMTKTGGEIILTDPDYKQTSVEGGTLAQWLLDAQVQFAFLCSCQTGMDREGFRGVAATLIEKRLPAVIAMQFNLPQQDAKIFVEQFYENFGKSRNVENALYRTRSSFDQRRLVWFIPALHSQVAGEVALEDTQEPETQVDLAKDPFLGFGSYSGPELFTGQHGVLNDLLDGLLQQRNVLVAGERRIGKTSLLRYLTEPEICRQFGLDPRRHFHVYYDVSSLQNSGDDVKKIESDFWRATLRLLERRIAEESNQPPSDSVNDAIQALKTAIPRSGDRTAIWAAFRTISAEYDVAFFLDEFDHLIHLGLGKDFFNWLSSLNEQLQVKFIAAPRYRPQHYVELGQGSSHQFFENCRKFDVGPLCASDFPEFLRRHFKDVKIPQAYRDLARVIQFMTGRMPYYLQIACSELFAVGNLDDVAMQAWIERFWNQAQSALSYHWETSSPDEQIVMAILALRGQGPGTDPKVPQDALRDCCPRPSALESLKQRALVIEQANRMALMSSSLEAWVLDHLTCMPTDGAHDFDTWYRDHHAQGRGRDYTNESRVKGLMCRLNPDLWEWCNMWFCRLRYQDSAFSLLSLAPRDFDSVRYLAWRAKYVRSEETIF